MQLEKLWMAVHNLIAHPLMVVLPKKWGNRIHDFTAKQANIDFQRHFSSVVKKRIDKKTEVGADMEYTDLFPTFGKDMEFWDVYLNGSLLYPEYDYVQTGANTLRFDFRLKENDQFMFLRY